MLIQVPEYFVKDKKILKSSTLSCLYYFNREVTTKVNIQLNQHLLLHVFNGSKNIYTEDNVYTITSKQSVFISKGQYFMSEVLSVDTSYFDGIMVFFDDAFLFSMWNKYKKIVNKKNADKNTINSLCIVEESLALHETMLSTQMYLLYHPNMSRQLF